MQVLILIIKDLLCLFTAGVPAPVCFGVKSTASTGKITVLLIRLEF